MASSVLLPSTSDLSAVELSAASASSLSVGGACSCSAPPSVSRWAASARAAKWSGAKKKPKKKHRNRNRNRNDGDYQGRRYRESPRPATEPRAQCFPLRFCFGLVMWRSMRNRLQATTAGVAACKSHGPVTRSRQAGIRVTRRQGSAAVPAAESCAHCLVLAPCIASSCVITHVCQSQPRAAAAATGDASMSRSRCRLRLAPCQNKPPDIAAMLEC